MIGVIPFGLLALGCMAVKGRDAAILFGVHESRRRGVGTELVLQVWTAFKGIVFAAH